jgi:hypothetical protein
MASWQKASKKLFYFFGIYLGIAYTAEGKPNIHQNLVNQNSKTRNNADFKKQI